MSYLEIDNTKLYYETKGEGTPMWLSCEAAELRIILPEFCFIFAVIHTLQASQKRSQK
jgi:hypothetical protein